MTHRRLPHTYPEGKWLFLTWHLHGSLPASHYPPPQKTADEAFQWIDRYLDQATTGPLYPAQPAIAEIVQTSLQTGAKLNHYELAAFVIMANHVHALLLPNINPSHLLKSMKGATARQANRLLGRTGEPFWQAESYDWVRDEKQHLRIVHYIECHPVKAGLVKTPRPTPGQAQIPPSTL